MNVEALGLSFTASILPDLGLYIHVVPFGECVCVNMMELWVS